MPPPKHPVRDVVVVLPGILGSTLAQHGKLVWAPSAGSVLRVIHSLGGSLQGLKLPTGVGDGYPDDGVEPVALMPDLHILPGIWSPVLGYTALVDFLRSRFDLSEGRNLLAVPYDWRLSNRYNGRRLKGIVEPVLEQWRAQGGEYSDARLVFICHSMGGLVARWYAEREGGRELTRKIVTLGTPFRGSVKALVQLVNGTHKGLGPLQVDLTEFARSLPALHQLLPEYACIENDSPSDLQKVTEVTLPEVNSEMVADGMRFHEELDQAVESAPPSYDLHPIVGMRQETLTTARLEHGRIQAITTFQGEDQAGDSTVPRLAATPKQLRPDSNTIRGVACEHGRLQGLGAVLDELEFVLTAVPNIPRAAPAVTIGVGLEEIIVAGEPLTVEARLSPFQRATLLATATNESGVEVDRAQLVRSDDHYEAALAALPPGAYRIDVTAIGATAIEPIARTVLVLDAGGAA